MSRIFDMTFDRMAAMTSAGLSLLHMQQRPPSACDVNGSLYALQFLIHCTFVLISKSYNTVFQKKFTPKTFMITM